MGNWGDPELVCKEEWSPEWLCMLTRGIHLKDQEIGPWEIGKAFIWPKYKLLQTISQHVQALATAVSSSMFIAWDGLPIEASWRGLASSSFYAVHNKYAVFLLLQ